MKLNAKDEAKHDGLETTPGRPQGINISRVMTETMRFHEKFVEILMLSSSSGHV